MVSFLRVLEHYIYITNYGSTVLPYNNLNSMPLLLVGISTRLGFRDREKGKIKSGHFVHKVLNMENSVMLSTFV